MSLLFDNNQTSIVQWITTDTLEYSRKFIEDSRAWTLFTVRFRQARIVQASNISAKPEVHEPADMTFQRGTDLQRCSLSCVGSS